ERSGEDYEIEVLERGSPVLVLALHGGAVEPGSDVLARAVAGEEFNFYAFRSLDPAKGRLHHVTSHRFDEPRCLALAKGCRVALSIHGHDGAPPWVFPGGRNGALRKMVMDALIRRDIPVRFAPRLMGLHRKNVVNLPRTAGVQLEVTWGLLSESVSPLSAERWAEGRLTDRGKAFAGALRDVMLAVGETGRRHAS
ncbi:MAG: poly-gamma-glutamate hydrolase family protein, partial [Nitrospinota bacterium]